MLHELNRPWRGISICKLLVPRPTTASSGQLQPHWVRSGKIAVKIPTGFISRVQDCVRLCRSSEER